GTGIMAAPPGGFEELINVYVHQGKARARRGAEVASQLTDLTGQPLSDIVMVRALRAVGEGVVVGWRSEDRKGYVLRPAGNGEIAAHIPHVSGTAEWFAADANASEPPIVIGVETFGKMFLAHAEMGTCLRGPTVYYDPIVRRVRALTADLDGTGAA